jgi:hypothetical protein
MDLDLFYPIEKLSQLPPSFESTLWTCISQFRSIAELDFKSQDQYAVFRELYLIVIYVFVAAEAQQIRHCQILNALSVHMPDGATALRDERIDLALGYANIRIDRLVKKIDQFSRREAQIVYIKGLAPGILSVLLLVAIYAYAIFRVSTAHDWTVGAQLFWHLISIALVSGALGAVVSVMLRVSNHPLTIDYSAGRRLILLAGCFRPIVGAIFGLVFYVLINAGLLQVIAAPHQIGSRAFFVAAICFAAGFSERRAQDVIIRALPTEKGPEADADKSPARRPEESKDFNN